MAQRPMNLDRYFRLKFRAREAVADEIGGLLVAAGALGTVISPVPGLPSRRKLVQIEAFFRTLSPRRAKTLRQWLDASGMLEKDGAGGEADGVVVEEIRDPGWALTWRSRFRPIKIGKRLMIVPPWAQASAADRVVITIEPGMGFGTGSHPTTRGALRALESELARRKFHRALDLGTGSGVLAIALRALGVDEVVGIDIDPRALENARSNALLNGISRGLVFSRSPLSRLRRPFGLAVANILSSTLIALAPEFDRLLTPDGSLILGGILDREVKEVTDQYSRYGFLAAEMLRERGWATVTFRRRL